MNPTRTHISVTDLQFMENAGVTITDLFVEQMRTFLSDYVMSPVAEKQFVATIKLSQIPPTPDNVYGSGSVRIECAFKYTTPQAAGDNTGVA